MSPLGLPEAPYPEPAGGELRHRVPFSLILRSGESASVQNYRRSVRRWQDAMHVAMREV